MDDISTAGWIAIIFLAVFLLSTNLSLLALLRRRKQYPPVSSKWIDVIKNPWKDEDKLWGELNKQVKQLTGHCIDEKD